MMSAFLLFSTFCFIVKGCVYLPTLRQLAQRTGPKNVKPQDLKSRFLPLPPLVRLHSNKYCTNSFQSPFCPPASLSAFLT